MTAQIKLPQILVLLVWMIFSVTAHPPGTSTTASESLEPDILPSVSPKILSFGNNYAMVCLQEKQFTDYCQKWGGYYCSSSGKLRTTLPNNEEKDFCEGHCECKNLFPKPNNCILGIAGSLYCRRGLEGDITETGAISQADIDSEDFFERKENNHDATTGNLLAPRLTHNYALVCAEQKELTFHCQSKYGMYCTANGALSSTLGTLYDMCVTYCQCVSLFPSPNRCFLGLSGAAYCARSIDDIEDSGAVILQHQSQELDLFLALGDDTPNCLRTQDGKTTCIPSTFGWTKIDDSGKEFGCNSGSAELVSRHEASAHDAMTDTPAVGKFERAESWNPYKKGEYIMICGLDDRDKTIKCLRAGYYCDSQARLKRRYPEPNPACEGVCECRDLNPKPICYMMLGAIMCARDLKESERLLDAPDFDITQKSDVVTRDLDVFSAWGGVNNYAMNCFDSSFATKICLNKGYYCDSSGRLVFKGSGTVDKACDKEWCQCINLNPVPKCYLAAAGVLRCKRFDGQTIDLAVTEIGMDEYHSIELRGEGLDLNEDLTTTNISPTSIEEPSLDPQNMQNLDKRHSYAMVCWENSQMTSLCNEAGYFCNKNGRLQHKSDSKDDPDCSESGVCLCVDLFPQPKCFWQSSGFMCARDDPPEIAATPSSVPEAAFELRSTSGRRDAGGLVKRHNYAMNCWDSSVMTSLCAAKGYYCNSKGEFVLLKGREGDKDCTDDVPCVCTDLFPKPKCFLTGSGVLRCITRRDMSLDWVAVSPVTQEHAISAAGQETNNDLPSDVLEQSLISLKSDSTTKLTNLESSWLECTATTMS